MDGISRPGSMHPGRLHPDSGSLQEKDSPQRGLDRGHCVLLRGSSSHKEKLQPQGQGQG